MLLDLAETLDPLLDARARRVEQAELGLGDDEDIDEYAAETTLQLIFFDGEEAFVEWTATDSIYGARSVLLSLSLPSLTHAFFLLFFSQTPRGGMGDDLPPPTSEAPPHLRLVTHHSALKNRAPRPPRPPRRAAPARAFLLPRHSLALRHTHQRRDAPPRRRDPRCRRARPQLFPLAWGGE